MSYLVLATILAIWGGLYLYLPANRLWLSTALGLSYFFWGLLAHKKNLHFSIVLEYLVIALLGVSLLIFLSLRA